MERFRPILFCVATLLACGCGGTSSSRPCSGGRAGCDPTAVRRIYPTVAGGREWHLPDDADLNVDPEFHLEDGTISVVQSGSPTVYHTDGEAPNAQIRMEVSSPFGKAWWRNVEMTGYYRWLAQVGSGQAPHWEMEVRGERHTSRAERRRSARTSSRARRRCRPARG